MPDESHVTRVGEFVDVRGAAQHAHESRRLFEELREAFALRGDPPLSQDLLSGFGANDQHTTDAIRRDRLIDGSKAVGPIDVLQGAVTDDRHELVFVPRRSVTAHHLIDLRVR